MDCYTCHNNQQIDALSQRQHVAADDHWRIAHAFDSTLPVGWYSFRADMWSRSPS